MTSILSRAQGALYGQIIGDSLGSLVEFQRADQIAREYPNGVRELADGGTYNLSAGQATDDTEMALALARSLVRCGFYLQKDVADSYQRWAESQPFDMGMTTADALLDGVFSETSQANGALMRISPVAIFCAGRNPEDARDMAREDAQHTHIHELCLERNELYAFALASAIKEGLSAQETAGLLKAGTPIIDLPSDFKDHEGWVEIAFTNTVWELENGTSFEESLVRTVGRGGDTDTNAAIAGAMLGGVYGVENIPQRWRDVVDSCRPGLGTRRPRPEEYWPADIADLAEKLLG